MDVDQRVRVEYQDWYQQGLDAHRRGDWQRAIAHYHRVLEQQPQMAMLHYRLGLVFDLQGRLDQAASHYETAIALDPNYRGALDNLGGVYLKQGQTDRAMATLQRAIASHPSSSSLWNNWGQALEAGGQVEAAIAAYEHALHLQPELLIAHLNLGHLWWTENQEERAIAQFQQIIQYDSTHILAHSHCAQIYFRQGRFGKAVEHWRLVAVQQTHLLYPYCQQVQQEQEHQGQASSTKDLLHQVRYACAQFLRALLEHRSLAETGQWLQTTYEQLGTVVMQDDGAELADYYLRQALRIRPDHPRLLLKLAKCLAQQQRLDGATMLLDLASGFRDDNAGNKRTGNNDAGVEEKIQPSKVFAFAKALLRESDQPYCQATTEDWVNTTAIAPLDYQPLDWPASRPAKADQDAALAPGITPIGFPVTTSVESVAQDCGGVTCGPCMANLRRKFQPYQVRPHILKCVSADHSPDAIAVEPYSTFVVTIAHGRCWVAPQENSWAICNHIGVITPDRTLLSDLSRDYPWRLPGCQRPQRRYHRYLTGENPRFPVRYLEGRVALLSSLSGHIYYHWMMDVLPRLGLLRQAGWDWSQFDAVVVNSVQRSFQRETLAILGVPESKVIESDRHPHLQATELIVPAFPGHLDWVPWATVDFLRSSFLPHLDTVDPPDPLHQFPACLYISRANAHYRRLVNESELLQQLHPLGFVAIALETLTVLQQVALFAQAKIIVAPHGAGLTNTVFCSPGTQIVEIASPNYIRSDYWIVSHQVGLDHYVVTGQTVACTLLRQVMYQNPLTEDIWLPDNTVASVIALLTDRVNQMHQVPPMGPSGGCYE